MSDEPFAGTAFVSIITVSLNAADTIRDTLNSVLEQRASFPIQHVCVDGGSSDATREIIDKFALRNPSLMRIYEPDRGLFDAMNKGLRAASGEYVLFLNADDFLISSDRVQAALGQVYSQNPPRPDMMMCDVLMGQLDHFGLWRHRKVPRWLPYAPRLGLHPPHQGNFIKRNLLLECGGFDAGQRLAADTTQFYKLVFRFRPTLRVAGIPLTFMRSGGASNTKLSSYKRGNVETYRFLRQFLPPLLCAAMVVTKVVQKIFEYRLGTLRRENFLIAD